MIQNRKTYYKNRNITYNNKKDIFIPETDLNSKVDQYNNIFSSNFNKNDRISFDAQNILYNNNNNLIYKVNTIKKNQNQYNSKNKPIITKNRDNRYITNIELKNTSELIKTNNSFLENISYPYNINNKIGSDSKNMINRIKNNSNNEDKFIFCEISNNLSLGLKQNNSKDNVLYDNINNINNVQNNTLSNFSSPKITNNKLIFNSDKEINLSNIIKNNNRIYFSNIIANNFKINKNLNNYIKKKSTNSQLNTSDTSSYKFKEIHLKLNNKKDIIDVCKINNLTNINELDNNYSKENNYFMNSNNPNLNILNDIEKYVLTNNTNDEDFSVSEIGFLSCSNKLDSNSVGRYNKNKFINLEKNYLKNHFENSNSNNMMKRYQNLNELGEILDDSNEKNLKSETKEDNNYKNSTSLIYFDKNTQTSFDEYLNQEKNLKNICHNIVYDSNILKNKNKILNLTKMGIFSVSDEKDLENLNVIEKNEKNYKYIKNFDLSIDNNIIYEISAFSKIPSEFSFEEENKNLILKNPNKFLELISDDIFYSDLRFVKIKKEYEQIHEENKKLILNESDLIKTTKILKNYIEFHEVIFIFF